MVAFEIHLEIESMGPPDEFDVRGEEKRQIQSPQVCILRNWVKKGAIY